MHLSGKIRDKLPIADAFIGIITDTYIYIRQHPHSSSEDIATFTGKGRESAKKYLQALTSIIAFLESTDYENAIHLSISLNGDADTMGAITGGIAETYYKEIPLHIKEGVPKRLPDEFINVMTRFHERFIGK